MAAVQLGFVGAGNMAEALIRGLTEARVAAPTEIIASDILAERRTHMTASYGVQVTAENRAVIEAAPVVVLAVKPQGMEEIVKPLAGASAGKLVISIAAGVRLAQLEGWLGPDRAIVRAMPNTPALVQTGATGLCGNARAGARDLALATALFDSVGITWQAPHEPLLDAVTGLSGSGPAYVFLFLEALIEAGASQGLPREVAEELATQTVYGAAKLARESPRSPAELRRQVSSPGGTTFAGLERLEAAGFAGAVGQAVAAATRRARELGRGE
jgi:pyrroline-5-carboxylate reductase